MILFEPFPSFQVKSSHCKNTGELVEVGSWYCLDCFCFFGPHSSLLIKPELLGLFFSKIFRRLLFEFDDQAKELFGFLNHYFLKIFGWLLLEFDHQAC